MLVVRLLFILVFLTLIGVADGFCLGWKVVSTPTLVSKVSELFLFVIKISLKSSRKPEADFTVTSGNWREISILENS